ncbi:MAG: hypothetical protein EKK45_13675 [Curvibacter sp.]|nr:MAG: hypothetical protein EKK45_13675 [Curvibacter sp.]
MTYNSVGQAVQSVARAGAVAANDAVRIGETVSLATPSGTAAVTMSRTVAGAAVRSALADAAIGFARGGVVGAGAVAAAALLSPLADKFMKDMGYSKGSDGSWQVPSMVPPKPHPAGEWCNPGNTVCTDSWSNYIVASTGDGSNVGGWCPSGSDPGDPNAPSDGMTKCLLWWPAGSTHVGQPAYAQQAIGTYHASARMLCPDGTTPQAGGCPDGTPQPADPAVAKEKAKAAPMPANVSDWAPVIDAMDATGFAPPPDEGVTVSGATMVSGQPVTSTETITDAQGHAQTVTTTETPVTYLDYAGDTVTLRTEVNKTTTNPDGSTNTSTKPVGNTTSDSPCFGLSSVLGCTQLGTPEAASMPTASKSITFTAESVSLPSGCPAPISLGRYGQISFDSACSNANTMRPFVLAFAAFSALMICVYAVAGVKT